MSREAVNRVLEAAPSLGLTHFEFRVLMYLADRLNKRTGQLNPSPERLALDCGLDPEASERNVRHVIDRLEAKGLVERVGSRRGGRDPDGRYVKARRHYRLRGVLVTSLESAPVPPQGGDGHHPEGGDGHRWEGGDGHPQNQGSRSEPGKTDLNLRSGSTTPLAAGAASAREQPSSYIADLYEQVQAEDDGAELAFDHGDHLVIRLSSGKELASVGAVKAYLDTISPEAW